MNRVTPWIDRFIEREHEPDPRLSTLQVRAFEFIFLIVYAGELIASAAEPETSPGNATWIQLGVIPFFLVLRIPLRKRISGYALLLLTVFYRIYYHFPMSANHVYITAMTLTLLGLFDPEVEEERDWMIGSLKWLLLVLFFYSGLQKVLYGHYFRGEFFAYMVAGSSGFRDFFQWFLPDAEIERLVNYGRTPGSGPYRLYSPAGLLFSHASYVMEMGLPILLLIKKLRVFAVGISFALIIGIELAAREFFFGMIFINFLMLFTSPLLHYRVRWIFPLASLILILARAGILKGIY